MAVIILVGAVVVALVCAVLVMTDQSGQPPASQAARPASDGPMKACPSCKAEIDPADMYCPKCGVQLSPTGCPSCGATVRSGGAFCSSCGARVHDHPRASAAPASPTINALAIASLVLGVIGLGVVGLFFGHLAMREIDASGGRQGGRPLAVAGIVLGWVQIAALFLVVILVIGTS